METNRIVEFWETKSEFWFSQSCMYILRCWVYISRTWVFTHNPEFISCNPDFISRNPDFICCNAEFISCDLDSISCNPYSVFCYPDFISCNEFVFRNPEFVSHSPEFVSRNPDLYTTIQTFQSELWEKKKIAITFSIFYSRNIRSTCASWAYGVCMVRKVQYVCYMVMTIITSCTQDMFPSVHVKTKVYVGLYFCCCVAILCCCLFKLRDESSWLAVVIGIKPHMLSIELNLHLTPNIPFKDPVPSISMKMVAKVSVKQPRDFHFPLWFHSHRQILTCL